MFMPAIENHLKVTPSPYKANIDDFLSHCAFLEQFLQEDVVRRLKQISDAELNYYQFCNLPIPDPVSPTPSQLTDIGCKEDYCWEQSPRTLAISLVTGNRMVLSFTIYFRCRLRNSATPARAPGAHWHFILMVHLTLSSHRTFYCCIASDPISRSAITSLSSRNCSPACRIQLSTC